MEPFDTAAPEARFAARALAAGLSIDDVARILREDAAAVRRHLRAAMRSAGSSPPPPAAGDAALDAALGPLLELARRPPTRTPATACPAPDITAALAHGQLDGPPMLALAEHAADCPECLRRVVAAARCGSSAQAVTDARRPRASHPWAIGLGATIGIAAAIWYLYLR